MFIERGVRNPSISRTVSSLPSRLPNVLQYHYKAPLPSAGLRSIKTKKTIHNVQLSSAIQLIS